MKLNILIVISFIPYIVKKHINVIDIETFGGENLVPYCISTMYNSKTKTFLGDGCIGRWLDWVFRFCKTGTTFYAHNLNFDGSVILNNLNSVISLYGKITLFNGNLYGFTIKKNEVLLSFKCSARLIPLSLNEISNIFETKKKLILDYSINKFPDNDDIIKVNEIITYCERDVEITNNFILKLCLSLNICGLSGFGLISRSYSLSGVALFIFKNFFNDFKINLLLEDKLDSLCRPGYYGGRCEVFGNPIKNDFIYHFDFSGMYSNRLTEDYPCGNLFINNNPTDINTPGIYCVNVYSDIKLPILPYREPKTGKLLFPNGEFSGVYSWEELMLFLENGGVIKKIKWGLQFSEIKPIFKNFAENCIKYRKNDKISKIVWKLIPNSFIGRLGLRRSNEETKIIKENQYDPTTLDVISDRKIGNFWLVRIKKIDNEVKITNGNVIYALFVTAKARILWWNSAVTVEKNGGRLLYCDTDSIFASFRRNVIGETHGNVFWDPNNKETEIEDACFASCKMYSIKYKDKNATKIKGVSRVNTSITFNEFKEYFYSKKLIKFSDTQFRKNFINMQIIETSKIIDFRCYDKRIFNVEKTHTDPIRVYEDTLYNEKPAN